MDYTIEKEFFKAFDYGSIAHNCIEYVINKYAITDQTSCWKEYYRDISANEILQAVENFDDSVILHNDSLMDEIETNLNKCDTDLIRKKYIYSLILPFKEFSDVYYPKRVIKRTKQSINEFENDGINCTETLKGQIIRCERISAILENITHKIELDSRLRFEGAVENLLLHFSKIINIYATKLDAILLYNNIDLMEVQEECGVYIMNERNIYSVGNCVGSIELAQKLIDNLPPPTSNNELDLLSPALYNPKARVIFEKLVEVGFAKRQNNHYIRNEQRMTKALLAYMLDKIYPDGDFPETELNKLFRETRLGKARTQLYGNKKPPKGADMIDKLLEEA